MSSILITEVECIRPDLQLERSDIYIENNRISEVTRYNRKSADRYVEGSELVAFPAFFDMHVHFRDPGFTYKEDIFTGAAAALAGGFTGVACMPNTKPPTDSGEVITYIKDKAANADFPVFPVGCITLGMQGKELCSFHNLKHAGAVAVSDDGRPVEDSELMYQAIKKASDVGIPIISHCEDLKIIDGGIINKGRISEQLGIKGMDRESENSITEREIFLAEKANAAIHIAHVSTKESVELIRLAKARGVRVTCETCPHYFYYTEKMLLREDADYRMNPPLREEADRLAIIAGLADGTIDCIVTDHAPHSVTEKADFLTAPNGCIGLETSLAATIDMLYHKNGFTLSKIAELMSVNPRKILGLPLNEIRSGSSANITLVDPKLEWKADVRNFRSKARNCAFKNETFKGKAVMTILNGVIRYEYK